MAKNFTVKTVHKGMYPATHNFIAETDGTSGTTIAFIDIQTTATVEIASDWQSHRKVLKLTSAGGGSRYRVCHEFTAAATITIEFWWGSPDTTDTHTFVVANANSLAAGDYAIYAYISGDDIYIGQGNGAGGTNWTDEGDIVDDQMVHMRFYIDTAADTFDAWIDGSQVVSGANFPSDATFGATSLDTIVFYGPDVASAICYYDAFGFSSDTNYKIGDNVFWRNMKESTDSFEGDDTGTQGTSITWVDTVNNAADHEIVVEFDEHKKVLRTYQAAGLGWCVHTFASQSTAGWIEGWVKVADANAINEIVKLCEGLTNIRIWVQIDNDRFEYDPGAGMIAVGVAAADNTWYHIYLQWYADNTFDLWVDNIQYLDGVSTYADFTGSGIDIWEVDQDTAGAKYIYLDAPCSSLDSDARGDNRIFEYNNTYTKTDITSTVSNVKYNNKVYEWRRATLYSDTSYEFTNVFFEIYDVNSALAMRGEIKNRTLVNSVWRYPLRDMNWDDLNDLITYAFTADDIHDPADSTSMLKIALPNVSHLDGDLVLVDADTKTTTYSPTLRFYPRYQFLRDISDLGDSTIIIDPNGKVYFDDDKASGDSLDVDTAAHKTKMTGAPKVTDILENINYFEIFGAINPDTGQRYYKLVDNSGTDKKRKWRYINNEFRNQTDVDNYASALDTRITTVKLFRFGVQTLGAHNMGELITYKYVKGSINIPSATYHFIEESIDFAKDFASIKCSEGMIESSKYSRTFERPQNYTDSYTSEIYETDINTVYPTPRANTASGATVDSNGRVQLNANNEYMEWTAYIDDMVDSTRAMTLTIVYHRIDAGADTISGGCYVYAITTDGNSTQDTALQDLTAWTACAAAKKQKMQYTIPATNLENEDYLLGYFQMQEAGKEVRISTVALRYYVKRSVS